ncbi:hypothetical protein Ciccas_013152, partial [Cichlidogyrus casuarinus]
IDEYGAKQWIHAAENDKEATFTNLVSCANYQIFVYARSTKLWMSKNSETVLVKMDFDLPIPASVLLHQKGVNSLQLYINGQSPNCAAFFYVELLADSSVVQNVSSSEKEIIFENLQQDMLYSAKVSVVSLFPTRSSESVRSLSVRLIEYPDTLPGLRVTLKTMLQNPDGKYNGFFHSSNAKKEEIIKSIFCNSLKNILGNSVTAMAISACVLQSLDRLGTSVAVNAEFDVVDFGLRNFAHLLQPSLLRGAKYSSYSRMLIIPDFGEMTSTAKRIDRI